MPGSILQECAALAYIQEGQPGAVGHSQGDVQIPQAHIAVHAENTLSLPGQLHGKPGAEGGFSRASFAGQHGDDLAQAASPSVRSFVHYKGNFHKNQEEKSSFLNNFHQIVQNQIHHFPFRPFADLRASSRGKNPSKKGVAPTRKLRYNAICKNTGESP